MQCSTASTKNLHQLGQGQAIFSNWNLYSKNITDFAHGLGISLRRWTWLSLAWAAVHNITKIQLVVNSSVVWLLESATDTHQLSTWVYISTYPVGAGGLWHFRNAGTNGSLILISLPKTGTGSSLIMKNLKNLNWPPKLFRNSK